MARFSISAKLPTLFATFLAGVGLPQVEAFTLTNSTAAFWKFTPAGLSVSHSFSDFGPAAPSARLDWQSIPRFVTRQGVTGVQCGPGGANGVTSYHPSLTLPAAGGVMTYGARFLLDSVPGPGPNLYDDHGMFLMGFYEGPMLRVRVGGHLGVFAQNLGNKRPQYWMGIEATNARIDRVGRWYEVVVTIDSRDPDFLKTFIWLDGKPVLHNGWTTRSGPSHDDGIRTSPLSAFQVGWSPVDDNGFHGVLSEAIVHQGFLPQHEEPRPVTPRLVGAVATDNRITVPGIDMDDYVLLAFDAPLDLEQAFPAGMLVDQLFPLSGRHSWISGFGDVFSVKVSKDRRSVLIHLSTFGSVPSVAVKDTVRFHLNDSWVVLRGSFNPAPTSIDGKIATLDASNNSLPAEFRGSLVFSSRGTKSRPLQWRDLRGAVRKP